MSNYFKKISITLVASLCLTVSSVYLTGVDASSVTETEREEIEKLKAAIEIAKAEGERLLLEGERKVAEAERQMREDFATARARSQDLRERRGRDYYPLPEPSNHRWIVVLCVNGAIIASLFALYFYRRWQKSQSLH